MGIINLFRRKKKEDVCEYKMQNGNCTQSKHDEKHCIFHSEAVDKKEQFFVKFWDEFKKQKKKKTPYDFTGFVFPGKVSFREKEFEKDVFFNEAKFDGEVDFSRAQFSGKAEFRGTYFSELTDFENAKFFGDVYFVGKKTEFVEEARFRNARFDGNADFSEVKFDDNADFSGIQFYGKAEFNDAKFTNIEAHANFKSARFSCMASFAKSQFSGEVDFTESQFYETANFSEAQFSGKTYFDRVKFSSDANFVDVNFEKYSCWMRDTYFYNVTGLFKFIEKNRDKFKYSNNTKFLPDNFRLILGETATARYPIIGRQIRDDTYLLKFKDKHPGWYSVWMQFADCGRSFRRWAFWSSFIPLAFAFIYLGFYCFGISQFDSKVISLPCPLISFLYYSIVTFTTLGFGDIVPKTPVLQIIVMIEVVLGYIMLGGLIAIFADRLARRS